MTIYVMYILCHDNVMLGHMSECPCSDTRHRVVRKKDDILNVYNSPARLILVSRSGGGSYKYCSIYDRGHEEQHVHLVAEGGVEGTVDACVVQGCEDELVHLAEAGTVVYVAQGGEAEHVHLVADGGVEGTVECLGSPG